MKWEGLDNPIRGPTPPMLRRSKRASVSIWCAVASGIDSKSRHVRTVQAAIQGSLGDMGMRGDSEYNDTRWSSARRSRGLEFGRVAPRLRIPLLLFGSKSIAVDRGGTDNALEIQQCEQCIANPVRRNARR
jgi:hypothetical protein